MTDNNEDNGLEKSAASGDQGLAKPHHPSVILPRNDLLKWKSLLVMLGSPLLSGILYSFSLYLQTSGFLNVGVAHFFLFFCYLSVVALAFLVTRAFDSKRPVLTLFLASAFSGLALYSLEFSASHKDRTLAADAAPKKGPTQETGPPLAQSTSRSQEIISAHSRRPQEARPFSVEVGPVLVSQDRRSSWVVLASRNALMPTVVFPAQIAAEVVFTNLEDHDIILRPYRFQIRASNGRWAELLRLDSTDRDAYFIREDQPLETSLGRALPVAMPLFDEQGIVDQPIKAKQALRGWVFFQYPASLSDVVAATEWRFSVSDSAAEVVTKKRLPGISPGEHGLDYAKWTVLRPSIDLSHAKISYIDDRRSSR